MTTHRPVGGAAGENRRQLAASILDDAKTCDEIITRQRPLICCTIINLLYQLLPARRRVAAV